MPVAIMPGSFDPPTFGHLDLFVRAAACFDRLVVAVGENVAKKYWFAANERAKMVEDAIAGQIKGPDAQKIDVVTYRGLLVDCAMAEGATVVVKGLRDHGDLSAELVQAAHNRQLAGLETLFLPARAELSHISSSAVKELVSYGVDPTPYVPGPAVLALKGR